jgi:hypothetical protein
MVTQRTTKTALTPKHTALPRVTKPTKALVTKTAAKSRHDKPTVADVPKVAAHVMKDAEIRLVRKMDQVATNVSDTAQVYRGMEAEIADRLQALTSSYGHLFKGTEEIQQRTWDMVQQSIGLTLRAPRELAQCTSFTEIAEKQQDLLQDFLSNWVTASHMLLTTSRRVVDRAIRPLELQLSGVAG